MIEDAYLLVNSFTSYCSLLLSQISLFNQPVKLVDVLLLFGHSDLVFFVENTEFVIVILIIIVTVVITRILTFNCF